MKTESSSRILGAAIPNETPGTILLALPNGEIGTGRALVGAGFPNYMPLVGPAGDRDIACRMRIGRVPIEPEAGLRIDLGVERPYLILAASTGQRHLRTCKFFPGLAFALDRGHV